MHHDSTAAPRKPPVSLPRNIKDALAKARVSWLKNTEVANLLSCHEALGFEVSQEAPDRPPSGSLFLFNKKKLRFYRKDGHSWRKKADGKTVRETHEKLKVGSQDLLNCYYAHSDQQDGLQRRCYWLLNNDDGTVLVHYLASKKMGRAQTVPSEPMDVQHIWDTARMDGQLQASTSFNHEQSSQLRHQTQLMDTDMSFDQAPALTTAPDLDRQHFASAVLPPLPSASHSRQRRMLMSMPTAATHQESVGGRYPPMPDRGDQFSLTQDSTPASLLSQMQAVETENAPVGGAATHAAHPSLMQSDPDLSSGSWGGAPHARLMQSESALQIPELPSAAPQSALLQPDSLMQGPESMQVDSEALVSKPATMLTQLQNTAQLPVQRFGRQPSATLDTAYAPGLATDVADAVADDSSEQVQSMLMQGRPMHNRTTSAPSAALATGANMSSAFGDVRAPVAPHRRQHSDSAQQAALRNSGIDSNLFAQQLSRQSMDMVRAGLQPTALTGQDPTALAGQYPAALARQAQVQLLGAQAASAEAPLAEHLLAWEHSVCTPSLQSQPSAYNAVHAQSSYADPMAAQDELQNQSALRDYQFHSQAMHDQSLTGQDMQTQASHAQLASQLSAQYQQETLAARAKYFSQDGMSDQGTLQWPLTNPVAPPATPPQQQYTPSQHFTPSQSNIRSLTQLLAQSQPRSQLQRQLQPPVQSQPQQLHAQSYRQTPGVAAAQGHAQSLRQNPDLGAQGLASDSHRLSYEQGQADAIEYLRRGIAAGGYQTWLTPANMPNAQAWQSPSALPDLEAAMAIGQQPTTQSSSEDAFYTW